jgi:hypothetical protein
MIRELRSLGYQVELSGNPAVRIDQDFDPVCVSPGASASLKKSKRSTQEQCNGFATAFAKNGDTVGYRKQRNSSKEQCEDT